MTKRKNKGIYIFLILSFAITIGCNQNKVYNETRDFLDNKWNKENIVNFKVPISDTVHAHNMYLHIRHLSKYDFQNLFLFINISSPEGYSVKDTFECILADDKGNWYGSGWGDMYQNKILYKKNILFPSPGTYALEIQQAMRRDQLKHISNIGLEIQKTNPE